MLEIKKTTKYDKQALKPIYMEAFPKEERAPFKMIYSKHLEKKAELLTLWDEDKIIGLVYNCVNTEAVYLFYLAIDQKYRQMGYGSKALALLRQYYPKQNIFIARESLNEPCDNMDQRQLRHQFYLKNGFKDLSCKIIEGKVTYEVMSMNGPVTQKQYLDLINPWRAPFTDDNWIMTLIES